MARDPTKRIIPRKTKAYPDGSRDPYTSSSDSDVASRDSLFDLELDVNALMPGNPRIPLEVPVDPQDNDDDDADAEEDEAMIDAAPDCDDHAVVIPWYEDVLGTSEEVAKSLYDDQDLKTPGHWASLSDKSIDAIAKQGQTAIPICLFDRLKLLAFTSAPHDPSCT